MSSPDFKKPSEISLISDAAIDGTEIFVISTAIDSNTYATKTITTDQILNAELTSAFSNGFVDNLEVGNTAKVPIGTAVASNTSRQVGTISFDANYMYITVSSGITKRVALESY